MYQFLYNQKYLEAKSKGWSGWGSENREQLGRVLFNRIISTPFVAGVRTALELGCGEGQLSRKLQSHGYNVTGVDISDVAVEWAKEKSNSNRLKYICCDLTSQLPSKIESYDLVVDGNCFHCIPPKTRDKFLFNVLKLMHDKSVFYVSSRCSKHETYVQYFQEMPYRYFPTIGELRAELVNAGFTLLQESRFDRGEQIHADIIAKKF